MFKDYYQQQLSLLRDLGKEFSNKHPSLAPMLAGQNSDPDVERLLEGVAFLTGSVQQRLDDDFPELIQSLAHLLFPHYMRPLPATTIVQFKPKRGLSELCKVKAGTELNSTEKHGVICKFTTCDDLSVYPLAIESAETHPSFLQLNFRFIEASVSVLQENSLRIFLSGSYANASNNLLFIRDNIDGITLSCQGKTFSLTGEQAISLISESGEISLFEYPNNANTSFKSIQEYFTLPKYQLYIDILGVDWLQQNRFLNEKEFSIKLRWKTPHPYKTFRQEDFQLFCVPAVNLFNHHADSISLDHSVTEYRVNPSGGEQYQIYSLDSIVGFQQGSVNQREYLPFTMFNPQSSSLPVYSMKRKASMLRDGCDSYISVAYTEPLEQIKQEHLAIKVKCTNGRVTDDLRVGDICESTSTSPVLAEFSNITKPTAAVESPLGDQLLWRMLSHLYINQASLAERQNLITLLKLYIFTDSQDTKSTLANTKRVEAIMTITSKPVLRLFEGMMARGNEIIITLDPDGFSSRGDMYLFGCAINKVMSGYSSINSFTRLVFEESGTSYRITWPEKVGLKCLV
ncbi:type VI secretion system baseplate subunit TssF [Enterovibrio norvegicus]|uniref:type VI secretion system baseplate subunit TssF n=1 Tax=Enterovibrio norvegicus TaxID=188144 RepID=UPI0013D6BAA6|nr:type VI secretion system baseplate subunit TssF [Enterovibrio norvegicus]